MKKLKGLISILMMASFAFVGCTNNGGGNQVQEPVTTDGFEETQNEDDSSDNVLPSDLTFYMISDVGGVQDRSFNQSAWEGMQRAEMDFGVLVKYLESNQDADYLPNLETAIENGSDLTFGIGYKIEGAMEETANNYPEHMFTIIDGDLEELDNVTGVLFKDHEASYLVGYIAGKMTETNNIGFIGGVESTVIDRFEFGFRTGVLDANPDAEIDIRYANSFTDQAIGKSLATSMYQEGVDIIFHASGDTGTGVIEAAKEQDKYVIGVDRDQSELAPDNVITSTIKEVGNSIYLIIEEVVNDEFTSGATLEFGLENGGVGIARTSNRFVPEEILNEVTGDITDRIISGEIFIPQNLEEFESR